MLTLAIIEKNKWKMLMTEISSNLWAKTKGYTENLNYSCICLTKSIPVIRFKHFFIGIKFGLYTGIHSVIKFAFD